MRGTGIRNFLFFTFLFIISVTCAFAVRTWHYNREADSIASVIRDKDIALEDVNMKFLPYERKNFVPFTIESAIMYSYTARAARGEDISGVDKALIGMENIPVGGQMSLGLEYFLSFGYKIKCFFVPPPADNKSAYEDDPDFTNWIRIQIRLWTSLTAGFIFLWLIICRLPASLALIGAFVYSFAPAAIARYTGQDLIRGEFAMPLITASFMLGCWFLRSPASYKLLLFGVSAFCAMAFWDICQIVFGLWGIVEIIRFLCGGAANSKRRNFWIFFYIVLVLDALLVPYHQTHRLLFSPLLCVVMPLLVFLSFKGRVGMSLISRLKVFLPVLLLLCVLWFTVRNLSTYADNYSHFGELLKAKIRFMNVKPANPEMLNFDARMLWTPMMHSVNSQTWKETKYFVPYPFVAFLLLLFPAFFSFRLRGRMRRSAGFLWLPGLMTLLTFLMFIFVVRYHDFCVMFLSVAFPLLFAQWLSVFKKVPPVNIVVCIIVAFFVFADLERCFSISRKYDIGGPLRPTAALIKWFRNADVQNLNVLSDMAISPLFKAYCHCNILLQPQFELGKTRKFVETYMNLMFHGTEEELNRFCVENKIDLLVYDLSYSYMTRLAPYSARYIAAAVKVERKSPAFIMSVNPSSLKWFAEIPPPNEFQSARATYRVFKVIRPAERVNAGTIEAEAENAFAEGDTSKASTLIKKAFLLDPLYDRSILLYYKLNNTIPVLQLKDMQPSVLQ